MTELAYLAPYGVGLGHASRMALVASRLQEQGIETKFSTFGEAARYVSMGGFKCSVVPPVEFAWGMEGGFSVKNSIARLPSWVLNFSRQLGMESRNMSSCSPNLVISDSRLSPILAARLLGIPCIVILNQVKLLLSPRLRELSVARLFETTVAEFLGSLWNKASRVLVPDLPPPYTLSEDNLWGIGSARLEYIGFTSSKPDIGKERLAEVSAKLRLDDSVKVVFAHVSGPAETRLPLIRKIRQAADEYQSVHWIISEGRPGGSTEPQKLGEHSWYYEWCPVRDEIFAISDALVLRGGHAALSQAIQFGKPVVTIPIENHGEQLGNSAKVQKLGAGIMLQPKGLKPESISAAVKSVLEDSSFRTKAANLMKLCEQHDGLKNIVSIAETYL